MALHIELRLHAVERLAVNLIRLAADVIRHARRRHEVAFVRRVDEHLGPRTCGQIPS